MTLVVIETGDGSHTFFDTDQNIYFRSLQGARTEADQVFVTGSRLAASEGPWRVLELGLGTALNFLATAEAWQRTAAGQPLIYTAVEAAPLAPELFRRLGHERRLKDPGLVEIVAGVLEQLLVPEQSCAQVETQGICLRVYKAPWQECALPENLRVDAIYHDPFGPKQNPEAWTTACFAWSGRHLDPARGRLVTYGAATAVRRAMVAAGLWIGALPGPGTKREMTVAALSPAALSDARLLPLDKYR